MKNIKSEIRKDYFLDKYVIITPGRSKRPRDIKEQTVLTRTSVCPLCTENIKKEKVLEEIKIGRDRIISVANIFPAVTLDNKKAYGKQEVIIETTEHNKELAELSEENIEGVLKMYAQRTEAISKIKNIDYILCFKNQGSKAGASIIHPHSQVFATEMLPPEIQEELVCLQSYWREHKTCPYCDIIKKEINSSRKIFSDKHVMALAPYASQYHYEAWIFARRHLDNIARLNENEFKSFARALKKILAKLHSLDLSFNLLIQQVVSDRRQHFYLKIQPRDSVWAGVELGSGIIINSVPPEQAAKFFKN